MTTGDARAPRVSVVIATRDAAATIGAQLRALASQDFAEPWEVIVVDQESTDGTAEILASWRSRLTLTVVAVPAGPGCSHARNRGAAAAGGEFVAFCDADDVVTPGWLSALIAAAPDADAVGGVCDVVELNPPDQRYWRGVVARYPESEGWLLPIGPGGNLLVRRDVFDKVGGFDERLIAGEDVDFSWRLQLRGWRLASADEAVVHYRLRSTPMGVAAQAYRNGRAEAALYRRHRSNGLRPRSAALVLKSWAWVVLNCWRLAFRRERGRWMWITGKNLGRVAGSARARVLWL